MTDELDPLRLLGRTGSCPTTPTTPGCWLAVSSGSWPGSGMAASRLAERMPSVYPRLAYRDEAAALAFLVRAFGFTERREARMELPGGMLAWLQLGDGVVMIGRAGEDRHGLRSPLDAGGPTALVNVAVRGIDAHCEQGLGRGSPGRDRARGHVLG